jgi:hypothetical protein
MAYARASAETCAFWSAKTPARCRRYRGRVSVKRCRANRSQVRLALCICAVDRVSQVQSTCALQMQTAKPKSDAKYTSAGEPAPNYCAAASEPGRRNGRRARSSTASALRLAIATIGWLLAATRSTATAQPLCNMYPPATNAPITAKTTAKRANAANSS